MKQFLNFWLLALLTVLPMSSFQVVSMENKITTSKEIISTETVEAPVVEVEPVFSDILTVKATYYNPVVSQCDSTPLITASGSIIDTTRTTDLHWCAISYNLHERFGGPLKFGDVIEIEGTQGRHKIKGKYIVKDLMNPRWNNKIDILRGTNERSVTFDSVKIKNKKIKLHKEKLHEQAKTKAQDLKRQSFHQLIQKAVNKVPFIGINDALRKENFVNTNVRQALLTNTDVSLNEPQPIEI